jgi:predicted acylesterase/phospholipase RssA
VVVDVIGGTSAGGINGVMLGAAIYTGNDLPNLREVWISLGDFRRLLRPATQGSPPSILRGDDFVLPELTRQLDMLFEDARPQAQELHIFVPATDLEGVPTRYSDSTGRRFLERDHRRVFHFTSSHVDPGPSGVMRKKVSLGASDAKKLLAHAARSSSSFPAAFEAHRLTCEDGGEVSERMLVDGGILDNQPFGPVLDQMAVLPVARPAKRVLLYVVPYVTEPDAGDPTGPKLGTALETVAAALSLPRDLPKLQGLERVTREQTTLANLEMIRASTQGVASPDVLADAARVLFESYAATRLAASAGVFESWADPDFQPGDGVLGQSPSVDATKVLQVSPEVAAAESPDTVDWLPDGPDWTPSGSRWEWGLSPAERAASWVLLTLGEGRFPPGNEELVESAEQAAGELIHEVRVAKSALTAAFRDADGTPLDRARQGYARIDDELARIQARFRALDAMAAELNGTVPDGHAFYRPAASVTTSLHLEVVRNAFGVQDLAIPLPFEFVMASGGVRSSLGHVARTPKQKLAGMKLNHFGGFLKRSWRSNDWLWGRLDGVEHLLRALFDEERLVELAYDCEDTPAASDVVPEGAPAPPPPALLELGRIALAAEEGAPESPEAKALLADTWVTLAQGLGVAQDVDPVEQYARALVKALAARPGSSERGQILRACRRLLAVRLQLRILDEDLVRVAETAREDADAGSSKVADGLSWADRVLRQDPNAREQVALFRQMHIGQESLGDETSSRLVADLVAQSAAVGAALLSGDRGGLPVGGRALLGSFRSATLGASFPVRLFARSPALGILVFATLIALVVWAAASKGTILGASAPVLALAAACAGVALFTMATSGLERRGWSIWAWVGFGFAAGVPAVFALAHLLGWTDDWLTDRCGDGAVLVAAILAGAAAAALVVAAVVARVRSLGLWLYRACILGALGSLVVGFVVERIERYESGGLTGWAAVANERRGAILIGLLLITLVVAGLILELLAPVRHALPRRRST